MRRVLIAAFALLGMVTATAAGAEAVGRVKTSSGEAVIVRPSGTVDATPGAEVRLGDTLRTGAGSALGVTLLDESRLSLQANAELQVDEFVYQPSGGDGSLSMKMTKGALTLVSGLIAKASPDAAKIETPVGTMGIRGTHVLVVLEEGP